MTGQVSRWVPCPPQQGFTHNISHHFLLVLLHNSGPVGPDASLESTPGSSSALRDMNLFHSCKPSGSGAEAFPQCQKSPAFSLHPPQSLHLPPCWGQTLPVCPLQLRSGALEATRSLRRSCLPLSLSLTLTHSHSSSTWRHSSATTAHWERRLYLPASGRGARHSLQPGTSRAVSTTQRSVCVDTSTMAGSAAPTPAGKRALWHVTTIPENIYADLNCEEETLCPFPKHKT